MNSPTGFLNPYPQYWRANLSLGCHLSNRNAERERRRKRFVNASVCKRYEEQEKEKDLSTNFPFDNTYFLDNTIFGNQVGTAIPRDMLPLDMLTPQIRHYELRQKNSRYANFSDLSTPSYAIF